MQKQFSDLFQHHYNSLCNYANTIIKNTEMAEELVQNLFVEIWERGNLDKIHNTEYYLLKATKYQCFQYLKTKKSNTTIPLDEINEPSFYQNDGIKEEEIEPLIAYFASQLPPKTQKVFLLSRNSKLTYKEIALELGISVKTVENQMGNALKKMRKLLSDYDFVVLMLFLNQIK